MASGTTYDARRWRNRAMSWKPASTWTLAFGRIAVMATESVRPQTLAWLLPAILGAAVGIVSFFASNWISDRTVLAEQAVTLKALQEADNEMKQAMASQAAAAAERDKAITRVVGALENLKEDVTDLKRERRGRRAE